MNSQLDLITHARTTDPTTSWEAAHDIETRLTEACQTVYQHLQTIARPVTAAEFAYQLASHPAAFGYPDSRAAFTAALSVHKRISDIAHLLVEHEPRRCTVTGRSARAWSTNQTNERRKL